MDPGRDSTEANASFSKDQSAREKAVFILSSPISYGKSHSGRIAMVRLKLLSVLLVDSMTIEFIQSKVNLHALTTETLREGMEPAYPLSGSPATMAHQIIITDAELPSGNFREFALMNASAAGDLFGRYVHPSNIAKVADEEIRVTFDTAFTGDLAFIAVGLALIRDLQIGAVGDFLDSSNAAIEVQGSATYREAVNSPTPIFTVTSFDKIKWQITIVNPGEFATGGTITQVDLYNKTSGGVQVLTLTVPTITTIATEDNVIRQFIEIVRI